MPHKISKTSIFLSLQFFFPNIQYIHSIRTGPVTRGYPLPNSNIHLNSGFLLLHPNHSFFSFIFYTLSNPFTNLIRLSQSLYYLYIISLYPVFCSYCVCVCASRNLHSSFYNCNEICKYKTLMQFRWLRLFFFFSKRIKLFA